jgi:hypothetical protein
MGGRRGAYTHQPGARDLCLCRIILPRCWPFCPFPPPPPPPPHPWFFGNKPEELPPLMVAFVVTVIVVLAPPTTAANATKLPTLASSVPLICSPTGGRSLVHRSPRVQKRNAILGANGCAAGGSRSRATQTLPLPMMITSCGGPVSAYGPGSSNMHPPVPRPPP